MNEGTDGYRAHKKRVMSEARTAGVTGYGLTKFSVRYLPNVIHENEHIQGLVYGRYREKNGPSLNEGLLVATEFRVIFVDHKPGFTKTDELGYHIVSGVEVSTAIFSAITLHTRIGDYKLRFINKKCGHKFVEYVERRRIEGQESQEDLAPNDSSAS